MSEPKSRVREVPATIKNPGGRDTPATIVAPAFTRYELIQMVRRDVRGGWTTHEQAERIIADGRRKLRPDGTPKERQRQRTRGGRTR